MAVKVSAQITISKVIDVYAVYRYYKLQSSTLAKPSKPTANPPSGWSDTEPAYVSGSTNTLYFVDCNVYSDKTFSFSEVSKSSSYEAAKDAWNKANNAQNTADSAKEYTDAVSSQYGYRYRKYITVYGDRTDYYYPVYLAYGDQSVSREVLIRRNFSDQAPSDWNTSTHKGGLTFRVKANYGNWGGAEYKCEILDFSEMYSTMVGDVAVGKLSGYGLCIWLRGGGTDGAFYAIYSDQPIEYYTNYGWHAEVPIIATKGGVQIGWYGGTEDNPSYTWVSDNPLSTPNTSHLNRLQALKTANAAISDVDVEYYLSTSATALSGGSWSTTAPTWVNGKYMWSRTVTVDGAGNKTYSPSQNGVCIAGAKGDTGATGSAGKGVKSIVEQYYKSTSATALSGGSWSTTYPGWENGKYIWTQSVITYTDNTSTTTTAVCVTGAKGDKGDKGNTGATGNGISKIEEHYAVSSSNSTAPTSWSSTVPAMTTTNKYLWNYETITYTSGSTADTTKRVIGVYGNTGSKGDTGANGKSIGSVTNYYLATSASSNVTTSTSGWTTTVQSVSASKKYLWNYEVVKYSDGTTASTTTPCIIGAYGDTGAKGDKGDTGATGKGVKSSAVTYQASTSGTTIPTGTWATTIPSVAAGSFLWTKTVITYTDSTTTTSYSVGKMGNTGSKGDKGETGATGKGVKSTEVTYQASTSGTTVPTGTWQTTIPSVAAGSFLWTKTVITYTDSTTSTSYSIGKMGNTGSKGDKGDKGDTGATGAMGETLSNGKLLYKDVMFSEGTNSISAYNNSSGGAVTVTRQAKSTDNPCGDYELLVQNTGTASPGIGGFKWSHATRANAVFIYRIIAKIPTGRALCWASNSAGGVTAGKFLTSNSGTGQFTEYLYKFTCGSSGTFASTGFFYLNGSAGTTSAPVKWYVAYAGVWDMTDYEDFDAEIKNTETSLRNTISEKSADIINECEGIILKALETYTSTSDFDEFKRTTENQLKILSDSTTLQIKQTTEELNKVNADLQSKFNTITKYFTFDINGLTIGQVDNPYKVIIDNDRYSMTVNDVEVMWIANGKVYTSEIEVTKVLRLIDYMIDKDSSGNVNCAYIGGDS